MGGGCGVVFATCVGHLMGFNSWERIALFGVIGVFYAWWLRHDWHREKGGNRRGGVGWGGAL